MKICAISDIHGRFPDIPQCDVLCIAGDIVELSIQRDSEESLKWWTNDFKNWVNRIDCEKVLIVPGNHDFYIERLQADELEFTTFIEKMQELTGNKVEFLIDKLYEYESIKFYGTPWISPTHCNRWAFEDIQHEYDEYVCPYEKILQCDILITHENPNYNEKLEYNAFGKYKHHFFGHWHNGISYGHLNQHNCSILDDSYQLRKRLKIVTIEL